MTAKLDLFAAAPALMKAWTGASMQIQEGLEPSLIELVKIRSSQINGCANCLNLHTAHARGIGETEQRIYLLSAWQGAPCFSERERAALGWTDVLTRLSEELSRTAAYEALQAVFSPEEQVTLTLMVNVINGWNRLALGFGLWTELAAVAANAKVAAA